MTEDLVLEFGNSAERYVRNTAPTRPLVGDIDRLDPQQVTFAGLALCNSDHDIHCGLSIVLADRAPETVAATDDMPVRVDWLQHELREGPAVGTEPGELLVIKDLAADARWPDFGRMCVAVMELRSMVSVQISVAPPDRAMLTWYSSEPSAFDHFDVDAALRLARLAAPLARNLIGEFREPLEAMGHSDCSRVAVAVGTVMAHYGVTSADAFDLLRGASHDLRRALLDVAIDVIADGQLSEEAVTRARRHSKGSWRRRAQVQAASTPPKVRTQPLHRHEPTGLPGALRASATGPLAIGGPEMWRDPSSPSPATPVPHDPVLPPAGPGAIAVRAAAEEPDE